MLGKRSWNNSYIIPSYAVSCYLMLGPPMVKKVFFTIPPLNLLLSKKMPKILIFSPFWPPKIPPNPSQIEAKRLLGRLLGPLGPSWQQSLKKRGLKVPQETPRRSQTSPKTLPKPVQNPSKINLKTHSKKTCFSNWFFHDFLFFSPQNPSIFHMMFNICLIPNSHQNPCLFLSTFSVFFHRARKMQFCKNWAPVQAGARFLRFRALGKAHEITHKIAKKQHVFSHRFYQKSRKIDQK